jgi:hypothetical protein
MGLVYCANGNVLTSTSSNSYNMTNNITAITTSASQTNLVFVQTNDTMNILYLPSLENQTQAIISSFPVDPDAQPVVSGNSLMMISPTEVKEYDITNSYFPYLVKTYPNIMKYTIPDLTYLSADNGYFYLVGNLTNFPETGSLNLTVLQT